MEASVASRAGKSPVDVEPIRTQPTQRRLARAHRSFVRRVRGEHLRDEEDVVAPPRDRLAHDRLDLPRSVHLRRVDVDHAEIERATNGGDGRSAIVLLHLPRPFADHWDVGPSAEAASPHPRIVARRSSR
jgi:hypothetical protein